MPLPTIKKVGTDRKRFYGVRFRPPSQFEKLRTPAWAANVAQSHSQGAKVVMGRTSAGNWLVQGILIKKRAGDKRYAANTARAIVSDIEG